MNKLFIAGNWKMNLFLKESQELVVSLDQALKQLDIEGLEVLTAPSIVNVVPVSMQIVNLKSEIKLAAQNMHYENHGAFTGEVSPSQLKSVACKYVILGHSERRLLFGEGDEIINKKVISALKEDITPILCIGETLEERDSGNTNVILKKQIRDGLAGISKEKINNVIIAYEPVWAIGTGVSATPDMASETHDMIRDFICDLFGDKGYKIPLLYGGSMNEKNAEDLLSQTNINGGLIGGASLLAESFLNIIRTARKILDEKKPS